MHAIADGGRKRWRDNNWFFGTLVMAASLGFVMTTLLISSAVRALTHKPGPLSLVGMPYAKIAGTDVPGADAAVMQKALQLMDTLSAYGVTRCQWYPNEDIKPMEIRRQLQPIDTCPDSVLVRYYVDYRMDCGCPEIAQSFLLFRILIDPTTLEFTPCVQRTTRWVDYLPQTPAGTSQAGDAEAGTLVGGDGKAGPFSDEATEPNSGR